MTNTIQEQFKNQLSAQLLKYVAGQYIFCPNCEKALHYKTVVIIDVWKAGRTEYVGQKIGCVHCFKPEGVEPLEKRKNIKIEITKF